MSRLLDSTPKIFRTGFNTSGLTSLSADIQKYEVIKESGTARNLDQLNLSDSIYED
jgi:hypothetical protein